METGNLVIDKWAVGWGVFRNGIWHTNTSLVITTLMEDRAPYTWQGHPEKRDEYRALVCLGCRSLLDNPDDAIATEIKNAIEEDIARFSPPEHVSDLIGLQELVSTALARGKDACHPPKTDE